MAPPKKAALAFIFVTVVLDVLALGIVIPVLPGLVAHFVPDPTRAVEIFGGFVTVWEGAQFVFSPILGVLSDRIGRRPVVLLSNLGLGLDYLLMAWAPSLMFLFIGRVISGVTASSFSVAGAYLADVLPPDKRAGGFGMLGAAFGLGFVVGPALGGVLGDVDPRLPFWVASGLSLLNAAYGFFVLPESLPKEGRMPFAWARANPVGSLKLLARHSELLGLSASVFLMNVAHFVLQSTFVLYANYRYSWNAKAVGLTMALVGICMAVVQGGLVHRVVHTLGERGAALVGLFFGAVGMTLYGLAPTGLLFCLAVPVMSIWGLAGPSIQGLMSRRIGPAEQGQLQGAVTSLQALGGLIGPLIFTSAFAWSRSHEGAGLPGLTFLVSAALLLASLGVAVVVTRGDAVASPPAGTAPAE